MIEINVCVGSACHLKGSYDVIDNFKNCIEENKLEDKVILKAAFCLGNCTHAVSVKVNDKIYSVSPETTKEFFDTNILGSI